MKTMSELLESITSQFEKDLQSCGSADDLEALRVKFLGRKQGLITDAFKQIGNIPPDERGAFGKAANELKQLVAQALKDRADDLEKGTREREDIDITLPAPLPRVGRRHPITEVRERIVSIFTELGYRIEDGPQIEDDFHNFQALNMPKHHPARDTQDTFYLEKGYLLRTHTSPVQIRVMQRQQPPIKIITPGRVYRKDFDITHTPMFSQVEGLVVDRGITFGDLKGTLEYFTKRMYGPETDVRFRPSFFPFTEPSAEVDISCPFCDSGCRVCKNSGWIEIMGCGMVDPAVFEAVDIDPEEFTGFAFGMGIERQVILQFGLDDSRLLFENDIRLLNQIGGWR
jgi:phenylalanyl-tRNA synthetase alpha chain